MKAEVLGAALAAAFVVSSVGPAAAKPATVISEAVVNEGQKRSIRVLVSQSEIKSNINGSQLGTAIMIAAGGGMLAGLIGGMIASAQNADREKKAETLIAPLRTSLADFNADELAQAAARNALADIAWLKEADISFGKDSSPAGRNSFLDQASDQVVFVDYSYDLSPEFDSVRVVETIQIANKALPRVAKGQPRPKPEHRITRYLAYTQTLTSAVTLPDADPKDKQANADRWAANNGALARRAVKQAFTRLAELTPRALGLTAAQVKAMNKIKQRATFGGLSGRLVSQDDDGTLIWAKQFVSVQPLAPAPSFIPAEAPCEPGETASPDLQSPPASPDGQPSDHGAPAEPAEPLVPAAAQPVAVLVH
jgi:hypothetical protein